MEPMTKPANIKDELADLRRNGDPRATDADRDIWRQILSNDELSEWTDELVSGDYAELDTET